MTDNGRFFAVFAGTHGSKGGICSFGRYDAYHLALVGYLEDVVAQHLAGAAHLVVHGHFQLVDADVRTAHICKLVERAGQAAACWVPKRAHAACGAGVQYVSDEMVERGGVCLYLRLKAQLLARGDDSDAVVANRAAYEHFVAGADVAAA